MFAYLFLVVTEIPLVVCAQRGIHDKDWGIIPWWFRSKESTCNAEEWVQSLGWEDHQEKEMDRGVHGVTEELNTTQWLNSNIIYYRNTKVSLWKPRSGAWLLELWKRGWKIWGPPPQLSSSQLIYSILIFLETPIALLSCLKAWLPGMLKLPASQPKKAELLFSVPIPILDQELNLNQMTLPFKMGYSASGRYSLPIHPSMQVKGGTTLD